MSTKFTEKDIGEYVNRFYNKYKSDPNQEFNFDLSQYDWISNQALVLISSIIKYLYTSRAKFKIKLFKSNPQEISEEQARTIVQLWEVWKLHKIFDRENDKFDKFIPNFSNLTILFLKNKYGIEVEHNVYNRLNVTPFISLNHIVDYNDENILESEIRPIFDLNEAISIELASENSHHPFVEHTLSAIVTRELYENFLDHYETTFFSSTKDMCFMSISLKRQLGREKIYLRTKFLLNFIDRLDEKFIELKEYIETRIVYSVKNIVQLSVEVVNDLLNDVKSSTQVLNRIQWELQNEDDSIKQALLRKNIVEEELIESYPFFIESDETIKNVAYLQYTFIDYGQGIPTSILSAYCKEHGIKEINIFDNPSDNELLRFAFKHYTSRFPIEDKYGKIDKYIPRGLFDVVAIAQKYKGLIIVRSNKGKLLFDFKYSDNIHDAIRTFGDSSTFFPGTYITLYLPELLSLEKFNRSVIRFEPVVPARDFISKNINLFSLIGSEFIPKDELYPRILNKLRNELNSKSEKKQLNYVNFFGLNDRNVISKIIYFLISDYEIHKTNSVLVLHPPERKIVSEINAEIQFLDKSVKNYKIHPLPLVYFIPENNDIELEWIGVYDDKDKERLNELLFSEYSLSLSDFYDPSNVIGNLIEADGYGNVESSLPNRSTLAKYYNRHSSDLIKKTIDKYGLLKTKGLYLCNGNYYQNSFLQLSEILDNRIYRDVLSLALFERMKYRFIKDHETNHDATLKYLFNSDYYPLQKSNRRVKYIAVTSSSHKIIRSFCEQNLVYKKKAKQVLSEVPYILFDNYLDIETSSKIELLNENTDYILVCDAIATGNLVERIDKLLESFKNSCLKYVCVLVNTLDFNFEKTEEFLNIYSDKIISICDIPIAKKRVESLTKVELNKELIRISPFTNLPIEFDEETTLNDSIIYLDNNESFLNQIDESDINIRFQIHNNLIHPYYFDIGGILEKESDRISEQEIKSTILYKLFSHEAILNNSHTSYSIFYPKGSGINYLDQDVFNSKINLNHNVHFFELERFPSESGWKFPHSSTYYKKVIEKKPNVIILDDGTCSGDSLFQMVNEISYFEPERIDLLCIISRVDDYKREFFSKLKYLRKHTQQEEVIQVNIFFGTQWHIPTFYLENNPYSEEILWLTRILSIKNTPQFIRRNARKILETVSPHKSKEDDYKYFPRRRTDGSIPKKEILVTRNEIGRISGYRFYRESFDWYNKITFKRHSQQKKSIDAPKTYKDVELLSMCLIYEPYLYALISKSFPDIKDHLEGFVKSILLDDGSKKINIKKDLYYDWNRNKKDIIHLFFIVFKGYSLMRLLDNRDDILSKFLEFAGRNERTLDYVLYKLTYYFTAPNDISELFSQNIKHKIQDLLSKYPSRADSDANFVEKITRFNNFIATLEFTSSDNSFENLKSRIEIYFTQINNPDYHNTGLNNDKTLINAHFAEIGRLLNSNQDHEDTLSLLKVKSNDNLIPYLNSLLSFSVTYRDYFVFQEDFDKLNTNTNSLRVLLNEFNELLYDNGGNNFLRGRELISLIFNNYFSTNFFLYKTLQDQISNDIVRILKDKISLVSLGSEMYQIETNFDDIKEPININFPKYYMDRLLSEIFNNLRHSNKQIVISVCPVDDCVAIEVSCGKAPSKSRGSNFGSLLFNNLECNKLLNCDCAIVQDDNRFFQKLSFQIVK